MPRPADTYTHSQFESIDSEHNGETVRCVHCKQWTGSVKTLNRKKEHLLKCQAYARWRSDGHGQDLAPPNVYNKRLTADDESFQQSQYAPSYTAQFTPAAGPRQRHPDLTKLFDEFWDDSGATKCMRVRCLHCGFVRAKNTTRQVEHLLSCKDYLESAEGQQAVTNGELQLNPAQDTPPTAQMAGSSGSIWRGSQPNPGFSLKRKQSRGSGVGVATPTRPAVPPPPRPMPSLVNYLLSRDPLIFQKATQQPFLSHAGCGTLSLAPLNQWLAQDSYISRAFISFIGVLIGKISLPDTTNSQMDSHYRTMDLLISALNNVRREMSFFETTLDKYGLVLGGEEIKPATKAFLDLFAGASSPRASLLEGLVVLWATEHCYRCSWQYASTFTATMPASTYSLPSYLQPGGGKNDTATSDSAHISALHSAMIPNWTSVAFCKFVDACRSIVDEIANSQTSGNGKDEMARCETVFKQVVWLWGQIWPDVDGMGQEDELARQGSRRGAANQAPAGARPANGSGSARPLLVDDDDNDASNDVPDSPFGGTGLGALSEPNRSS
ncbi:heme oxygenase-like protein [Polychaeton citri CBS 116435]|uniref:Heme oxygenase-like protein n=1 Tax=Polychaeton citri CBS 116435 TaxID=1314669 RepID=A0A9P4Q9X5_9PEZI|nr:heme oxygenase-like protein [Polychaeton citri CBS 116435]